MRERRHAADVAAGGNPVGDEERLGERLPVRRRKRIETAPELEDLPRPPPAVELARQNRRAGRVSGQKAGVEHRLFADDVEKILKCHCSNYTY